MKKYCCLWLFIIMIITAVGFVANLSLNANNNASVISNRHPSIDSLINGSVLIEFFPLLGASVLLTVTDNYFFSSGLTTNLDLFGFSQFSLVFGSQFTSDVNSNLFFFVSQSNQRYTYDSSDISSVAEPGLGCLLLLLARPFKRHATASIHFSLHIFRALSTQAESGNVIRMRQRRNVTQKSQEIHFPLRHGE